MDINSISWDSTLLKVQFCYSSVSILDGHIIKLSEVILYQNVYQSFCSS